MITPYALHTGLVAPVFYKKATSCCLQPNVFTFAFLLLTSLSDGGPALLATNLFRLFMQRYSRSEGASEKPYIQLKDCLGHPERLPDRSNGLTTGSFSARRAVFCRAQAVSTHAFLGPASKLLLEKAAKYP